MNSGHRTHCLRKDGYGILSGSLLASMCVWLAAVVGAMAWMIDYSSSPGPAVSPPAQWPTASRIPRDADRASLVLFAHPRCPCTRSSLDELDRLLGQLGGQVRAHVVFIQPAGRTEAWVKTDLWRKAAAIPGVSVHRDEACTEAQLFQTATSGHALLYDSNGQLEFQGGITLARGHAGDNPGQSALVARLVRHVRDRSATPVFGCPLFAADERQERNVACQP